MPTAPDKSFTSIVRAGLERSCRDFTARVEPLGFGRTLKMFWTRRHPLTVDLIHFHRHGSTSPRQHLWRSTDWLALSVLLFGVLMAFRSEFQSIWLRALVAGVAGAVLYTAVQRFRNKP